MNNNKKLQAVLKEIFEIDKADLDFGIYRIMNQKRDDVNKFIEVQLPKDIKEILSQIQTKDSVHLQQDLDKLGSDLDNASVVRESSPKYLELQKKLEGSIDVTAMEQEIFSHLTNFFKRYYNEGDFISQRRYKKDVYAIPYGGEEVKLHWANADQYYIKTSEYLKNYTFVLRNRKKVTFQLKEASTEQDNNKTQSGGERRFAIYKEVPIEVKDNNLYINFTYELHKKSEKQDALMKDAFDTISSNIPVAFVEICTSGSAPTEKNKSRTLLEKHLNDYVSRNTFDYFIHKDLGGFLRRELDFYIKNEILYIDDINTESPAFFTAQLSKIKAFKTVADKIITFLAQIEDFQKKLWLKKKFVIRTDYCITLDRIPAKYYKEIFSNAEQLKEWENLFSVKCSLANNQLKINNEIPIPLDSLGIDNLPSTIKYAVLDTKYFTEEFKDKLMAEFYNLDKETNGLLINSENFQALNLMQEKYKGQIKSVFIDPPYNTEDSEGQNDFSYKDNFPHSSWISMMRDRIYLGYILLANNGIQSTTISDEELKNLIEIFDTVFLNENRIGIIEWNSTKSVTNTALISMAHTHIPIYTKEKDYYVKNRKEFRVPDSIEGFTNPDNDPRGKWKADPFQVGGERPNQRYEIKNPTTGEVYLPNPGSSWKNEYEKFKELLADNRIVFGKTGEAGPQRKRFWYEAKERGKVSKTWWDDIETTTNGTQTLKKIFNKNLFTNPKPVGLMERLIELTLNENFSIILDYFSGSGTTAHATIKLNREDKGHRKYILVEMGAYFDTVTKPRVQKVIYTDNWKNGKPQDTEGISQLFKYQVLESYEDTLNNLVLAQKDLEKLDFDEYAQEEYLLQYMLDVESRDQLFNVDIFQNPFDYKLKVTENNELIPTKVDLVETFNYLIGLYVEHMQRIKDIKFVEGSTREGIKTLVIWRNLDTTTNKETEEVFRKLFESERTSEFQQIYINGDHNLTNFRTGEDQFKVKMIEQTFFNKMFNVNEL